MINFSQYLTIAQAAIRRGVTRQTIYNAIADGRLRPIESPHGPLLKIAAVEKMDKLKPTGRPKKS